MRIGPGRLVFLIYLHIDRRTYHVNAKYPFCWHGIEQRIPPNLLDWTRGLQEGRWFSPWQIVLYWRWRQSMHSIWPHLPRDIWEDQRETPWAHHEIYPFILPWHPNPDRENTYPGTRKSPWTTGSVDSAKNRTATTNNLNLNTFAPMGSTMIKAQNGSFKESDSAWKNANIRSREGDFPCLVVLAGLSLSRLRSDASWWMEGSGGQVNIVLIIWIWKDVKMLHIEKYIPGPAACANLVATVVINCAASSTTVTGAPLVLEFNRVFDRQPNSPLERDIVFLTQDLQNWGKEFWAGIWAGLEGLSIRLIDMVGRKTGFDMPC